MEQTKEPIIAFLGDDITAGSGASDKKHDFCSRLEEMAGFTIENYGVDGARITPQSSGNGQDFLKQSAILDPKADVVFVFGGTNDFGSGDVALGKLGDKDPHTFYGALALLCESLLKRYRKEQLAFVLPMPRFDGDQSKTSAPLSAYCSAIEEAADTYGIFALDLTGIFPVPQDNRGDEYTADGVHPNDRGHDLLAQIFTCYLWDHYHYEPRCFPKEDPLK
jgi:lysophospholipase L1-like esterase